VLHGPPDSLLRHQVRVGALRSVAAQVGDPGSAKPELVEHRAEAFVDKDADDSPVALAAAYCRHYGPLSRDETLSYERIPEMPSCATETTHVSARLEGREELV